MDWTAFKTSTQKHFSSDKNSLKTTFHSEFPHEFTAITAAQIMCVKINIPNERPTTQYFSYFKLLINLHMLNKTRLACN